MRSAVAQQLKQRTAHSHANVEAVLDLAAPTVSAERLRAVLTRFAGFWQSTERLLDDWADREPGLAHQLRWPRRRRREVLRSDLLGLGLTVRELNGLPEAPGVFTTAGTPEALGWLYVSEGSTLGGAVIDRSLRALPDGERLRVRTFTPYLEGPGPMWRDYLTTLTAWVGEDAQRREQVVSAAELTFAALEQWLAPLTTENAA